MTTPKGFSSKSYRCLPVVILLPILLIFLPYVSVDGKTYSGLYLISNYSKIASDTSAVIAIFGGIGGLIAGVATALSVAALLIIRKKAAGYTAVSIASIYGILEVGSFFEAKVMMDNSLFVGNDFMIKDLCYGFWLSLAFSIFALWLIMSASRVHTEYIILVVMSVIWLFPIFYITLNAFRQEGNFYVGYFWPKDPGFKNFKTILTDDNTFHYVRWFKNTLIIAICSCILSTIIVLQSAYVLSRIRFVGRKLIMNLLLVLGMFPGFMSMIAVYYILKGMGLAQSHAALVLVYSGSASLGYYVAKGFFDTVSKSLDEAAYIDGATKWDVFTKIIIPLSKPIIIYTVLTSFMGPWADYIFASVILGDKSELYTIAMGLFNMLSLENINKFFTAFAAGAVLISIPIAALFISLQKYYVEGLSGSVKG